MSLKASAKTASLTWASPSWRHGKNVFS